MEISYNENSQMEDISSIVEDAVYTIQNLSGREPNYIVCGNSKCGSKSGSSKSSKSTARGKSTINPVFVGGLEKSVD